MASVRVRPLNPPPPPGPSGLRHRRVAEIQRSRMLAAAAEAVAERGYAHLTVAEIIGRARVSRKTFYEVFEDRETCFLAVFERALERAEGGLREASAEARSWRESMRAGLAGLLAMIDREPELARVCIVEALGAGERVLERRAEALRALAGAVDRGRGCSRTAREPPEIAAEAAVGAVFAILHARLSSRSGEQLSNLLGPLMSVIVLPFLGARATARELELARRDERAADPSPPAARDPLAGLAMRLTDRTVRVLAAVGEHPGASNREVAERAGIADQGQMSKLLARLAGLGLVVNRGEGPVRGAANAWHLTPRGALLQVAPDAP